MKSILTYLYCAILILLISCTSEDEIIEPSTDLAFGIRHDRSLSDYESVATKNDANLPDFSSVIQFEYSLDGSSNRDFIASGVLIDSVWILTAAHNFYDASEQKEPASASGVRVNIGLNPNSPDKTISVSDIILHPTWEAGFQEYSDANDLCLVKLSSPVTDITPASLFNTTNESIGETVWHTGFGDYSQIQGQDPNLYSKKHAIENTLDRVIGGLETSINNKTYTGGLIAFDFDSPSENINALGDDLINIDEKSLGSGTSSPKALNLEGTTVTGDSGGPLFLRENGKWKVAGILSGGASEPILNHTDGDYGDISIYTRVSTSIDWIQSSMK